MVVDNRNFFEQWFAINLLSLVKLKLFIMTRFTICKTICLLLPVLFVFSCHVSYVSFRPEQKVVHSDTAIVTRVYIDRYGDFYPDPGVPIDSAKFKVNGRRGSKNLGSLSHYFLSRKKRMRYLSEFYGVSADSSAEAAFREVQRRIKNRYVEEINHKILRQHAGRLVYLVHGLNDTMAEAEYDQLRDTIAHRRLLPAERPVFVDIHWDSLNAHVFDGLAVVKVWKPAQVNSIFVSLSLRELMTGVEQQTGIPTIVITHSLGAGVALGAMFNTVHKWKSLDGMISKANQQRLSRLMLNPTPVSPVRIAIIAPAIPGETTFTDFNLREPSAITASQNNIGRVVIGYNYKDYAVSKQLLDIDLAPIYGSTTLGCNYTLLGVTEIDRVFDKMKTLGYGGYTGIIVPMEFQTPVRKNAPLLESGTCEHAFCYYIDNVRMKDLLTELFGQ